MIGKAFTDALTRAASPPPSTTFETVQAVLEDGRYVVRGAVIPATGDAKLSAGARVAVSWRQGRPAFIHAHHWKRGGAPIRRVVVDQVVEELRMTFDASLALTDVLYRNGTVQGSLRAGTAADPIGIAAVIAAALAPYAASSTVYQQIVWGQDGKSFAIQVLLTRGWAEQPLWNSHIAVPVPAPVFLIFELDKAADVVATTLPAATLVAVKELPWFSLPTSYQGQSVTLDLDTGLPIVTTGPAIFPVVVHYTQPNDTSLQDSAYGSARPAILLTEDREIVALCTADGRYSGDPDFNFSTVTWGHLFVVDTALGASIAWQSTITNEQAPPPPVTSFILFAHLDEPHQVLRYWQTPDFFVGRQELIAWNRGARLPTATYVWAKYGSRVVSRAPGFGVTTPNSQWTDVQGQGRLVINGQEHVLYTAGGKTFGAGTLAVPGDLDLPVGTVNVTGLPGAAAISSPEDGAYLVVAEMGRPSPRTLLLSLAVSSAPAVTNPQPVRQLVVVVNVATRSGYRALAIETDEHTVEGGSVAQHSISALARAATYKLLETTATGSGRDELWSLDESPPATTLEVSAVLNPASAWPRAAKRGAFVRYRSAGSLHILAPSLDGARETDEGTLRPFTPPVADPDVAHLGSAFRWRAHRVVHRP